MNPYDILGVRSDASDEEISRAYKRLAKRYHPDLNPNDTAAAERMGRINRAYDDIKLIRQGGMPNSQYTAGQGYRQQDPYEWYDTNRAYYSYRPRTSPMWMILAAVVMFFLVRLVLSLLFGGYIGSYYVSGIGNDGPVTVPGYGYYYDYPAGP